MTAQGERGTDPLVGAVLDKDYSVVQRIGIGGMSIVYLVEHMRLRKTFAAKLLHLELAANHEALSRFEIEAKAASQLEHENIVRVTDYGIAIDGRPYIIMELLKGRTLDEYLIDTPVTLQEAVLIIVSVCRALTCSHADGIVHRDIKPDNIFITQRSNGSLGVKVLDFGIAKAPLATGRVTKHGQTIGSPHYMAPEACRGEEVDHRADIYSVGVLMYLLFTGSLPHHDENFLKLLQKHVLDPVTPPSQIEPSISPQLEAVIMKALEKDQDDRYLSIEYLMKEFELALPEGANELLVAMSRFSTPLPISGGSGIRTPLPGFAPPTSPSSSGSHPRMSLAAKPIAPSRSRAPLFIVLLLLLLGGGAVGIWFYLGRSTARDTVASTTPAGSGEVGSGSASTANPGPRKVGSAAVADVPDPPPTAKTVHLSITTRPTRALIRLGNSSLGRSPLEADVAPVDLAQLEISASGYDTETRQLALATDQTLEFSLVRSKVAVRPQPQPPKPPKPPKPPSGSGSAPANGSDLEIRTHR